MTAYLRRCAAALLVALGFATPASAGTAYSTDYTDLWFNTSEQGWGINLIQQHEIIFATLFVYGADNSARWYVASALTGSGNTFTGQLFQTTGPAFSGPWTGAANATPVGSMTITFTGDNSANLSYTVSGATVNKSVVRQTWRGTVLAGQFVGGWVANASSCASSGAAIATGILRVTNSGTAPASMSIQFVNSGGTASTCNYNGTYSPAGRLGTLSGTYSCTVGTLSTTGSFTLSQVDVGRNGFSSVYSASDSLGCNYSGFFGGVRDTQGN